MINLDDVVEFIEKKNNIKLFDFQVKFLDNLIHGKTTRVSRNFGKSMLIKGYANYLNYIEDYGYCKEGFKYDDFISGDEIIKVGLLNKKLIDKEIAKADAETIKKIETEYCIKCD